MKHLRLFDLKLARKLTSRITRHLKDHGIAEALPTAIAEASGTEHLPEVHLFQAGYKAPPWTWILPTPTFDESTLVYAYEAFAEQSLGITRYPGRAAEEVLAREFKSCGKGAIDLGCAPRSWLGPAARLVALAQAFPGAQVRADFETGTFSATLVGGAHLEVSPRGVYSNFQGLVVPAVVSPEDVATAAMRLEAIDTGDRTLVALARVFRGDEDKLRMLRALAACLESGAYSKLELRTALDKAADPSANRRLPARFARSGSLAQAREDAVELALQAMAAGGDGLMSRLYHSVVPVLYSSREFVRQYGSISNRKRKVSDTTLNDWAERITERARTLK